MNSRVHDNQTVSVNVAPAKKRNKHIADKVHYKSTTAIYRDHKVRNNIAHCMFAKGKFVLMYLHADRIDKRKFPTGVIVIYMLVL